MKLSDALPDTDENRDYLRTFIKNGFKLSGGISKELTKDGKEKYFSNSMVAVIKNGKLINAWGTQTDVTDRKQAEENLKSKNKELQMFNDIVVDRELKMIELKKEINKLLEKSGEKPKYKIPI